MIYNAKKIKKKIKHTVNIGIAVLCVSICIVCFCVQLPTVLAENNTAIATVAAGSTMPDGAKAAIVDGVPEEKEAERPQEAQTQNTEVSKSTKETSNKDAVIIDTQREMPGVQEVAIPRSTPVEGEDVHSINERYIDSTGADTYGNISVKNTTGVGIDIGEELSERPDVNITKNTKDPQVLIYHTHTTESYMTSEETVYPENFYARTTDDDYNVVAVGNEIAQQLQDAGISVIHDSTVHDNPSYVGSYYRSEDTVTELLNEYPTVQVTIDIHRDAIGNDESGHTKPTCTIDGQKAAQIMVVAGCDPDGSVGLPDWEYNLRLAMQIQQTAENMYPGLTRPMQFCDSQYNMEMTHGSLLIEVGSDVNTIDEAKRSGDYLGKALAQVLDGLQSN